jgi:hypothetical protein
MSIGIISLPSVTEAGFAPSNPEGDLSKVEVNVNGKFLKMDVPPMQENNRLFVPIRTLESLGLSYVWNPNTRETTIQNNAGDNIKIKVYSVTAYKNNEPLKMDAAAKNKDGRVLVPIRFISETLGLDVNYEMIRKIVFINSKDYKFDMSLLSQSDLEVARRAAISLPISANFKTLGFSTLKYHSYSFPVGKANTYVFSDGHTSSIVEIKDSMAIVVGQYVLGARSEFAYKAGNITGKDSSDPILKPYLFNIAVFSKNGSTGEAFYTDQDGTTQGNSKKPIVKYSDIIQKLPDGV